jgi:hypothetical protein
LLRLNPETAEHVNSLDDLDSLPKPKLLALAKKLKIDARKVVKETMKTGKGLEAVLESDDLANWRYSERWPGFAGEVEFDMAIEMFGKRAARRMKADFTHTPEWAYFDLKKQAPYEGWANTAFGLSIRAEPEPGEYELDARGRKRFVKPAWVKLSDFTKDGIIPSAMWDDVYDAIDEACKAEDQKRRRVAAAGKRVTDKRWSAAMRSIAKERGEA